jgi:hypothetical protein
LERSNRLARKTSAGVLAGIISALIRTLTF